MEGGSLRVLTRLHLLVALTITVMGCSSQPSQRTDQATSRHPLAGESAWIAYQTDRGSEGTWLIHPDGTDDHQIDVDFDGDLILPNWSPDGKRLVMTSRNTGGTEPLYEYDLATERTRQLFECKNPCLGDDEPVCSPDGKSVAFIRALSPIKNDLPSDCGLWMGDIASGEVKQVTSNRGCDREYSLTGHRTARD